jgi:hypothetical protein
MLEAPGPESSDIRTLDPRRGLVLIYSITTVENTLLMKLAK